MKTTAAALACAAACAAAQAQSSVTLFGVADAAVSEYRGAGSGRFRGMTTGNLATGRLGVRGVEDLGAGLSASFWLEAAVNNDDGRGVATNTNNQSTGGAVGGIGGGQGLTFNRRSTLSLAGGFGELRLGRDYTPSFWNLSVFDPYGVLSAASVGNLAVVNTTQTSVRASNSIGYFTPGCSSAGGCPGFYGQAMVAFGENASSAANADDGNYWGLRGGYNQGPFQGAIAYARTQNVAASDFVQTNAGAAWEAGFARFMALYGENRTGKRGVAVAGTAKAKYWLMGVKVPLGASDELRVSYTHLKLDNANGSTAGQIGLGWVHNFSKRTAVYAIYARLANWDGTPTSPRFGITGGPAVGSVNGTASGLDIGIRHTF